MQAMERRIIEPPLERLAQAILNEPRVVRHVCYARRPAHTEPARHQTVMPLQQRAATVARMLLFNTYCVLLALASAGLLVARRGDRLQEA
jgi:hypothetical protein